MAQKYLLLNFDRSRELRGQQFSSECILVVVVEAVVEAVVGVAAVAFVADVVVELPVTPQTNTASATGTKRNKSPSPSPTSTQPHQASSPPITSPLMGQNHYQF